MSVAVRLEKKWYQHWALWTVIVLGCATLFGWSPLKARYHHWVVERELRKAKEFLANGDAQRAFLCARRAFEMAPSNIEVERVCAEVLEGGRQYDAALVWRSRLESIEPDNQENLMAWAEDAILVGDLAAAERVLGKLKPESRNSVRSHMLAARLAADRQDMAAAETHWAEAVRLKPDDDACRLPLAIIRLNSKDPELRNSARAVLTEISRKPPRRTQALRVLIADAMKNVDYAGVVELSDALVADPAVTFDDKLIRLRAIRSIRLRESASYLEELRDAALSKPGELYVLLMWMNENDLALLVQDWARTCLQDVIIAPPVSVAVADAYVRSSEWAKLCEFTDERDWADSDYLRRAFRARAWERLGDGEKSSQEWTDALSLARGHKDAVQCQERLARVAIAWGWKQRAQEVMWSMAGSPACPRWILNTLWNYAIINSDAPQLQRLAGIIVQRDSKSVTLRNNFAFYSLLVRSENGDAHGEAERLSNGNPGNADIALTRALSLHQQGRSAEAVTLTGSLPAEELKRPQFALYHSIFLTAAGDGGKAAAFLPLAEGRKMFPEEKTMLERARQSVAKAAGEQEVAERSKAMRAAKTGTDLDMEKAIEAARVARAAKLAKESEEAKVTEAARAAKAEAAKEAQAAKDAVAPPPFVAR